MNEPTNPQITFPAPISFDWTIERLLEWFAEDDARLSDRSIRVPLRAFEEALTGTRWTRDLDASLSGTRITREPAIISLVRSIALHTGSHPAQRATTLAAVASLAASSADAASTQMAAAAASSSVVATS